MTSSNARYSIYGKVHKGLRNFMADTLQRCGATDWQDNRDSAETLAQVRQLMEVCLGHLQLEDSFVHVAMEARRPGSSTATSSDHHEHVLAIKSFLSDAQLLESSPAIQRDALGAHLYRRLALFVAENYEHMAVEETDNNAVLWACYSDAEILDIEHALVASIPPAKMNGLLRWMLPSVNASERAMMLAGMKQNAPAEAFDGVMQMLRGLISQREWDKLTQALGCAQLEAA